MMFDYKHTTLSLFVVSSLACSTGSNAPDTQVEATSTESATATEEPAPVEPKEVDTRSAEHKDMDAFCEEVTALVALEKDYADMPLENRQKVMARRISERLRTRDVRDMFSALETARPNERYDMLLMGAEVMGIEGWTCPPIEELWK